MPLDALLLTLAAAVVHAGWNLLLSDAQDTHAATAVAVVLGLIVFAPAAAIGWRADTAVIPYVAASSTLELLYLGFLATGYALAEMSFVYPIARGSAPVFVLAIGALALGASVPVLAAGGVLLVASGVVLVRGLKSGGRPRELGLALAVGACIAGYTLVDKHGIEHAAPIAYVEIVFLPTALCYLAAMWRLRGCAALRTAVGWHTLAAGIGFFGAYWLVLQALSLAPAASVAAVRETSVVLAVGFVALRGREPVKIGRVIGAMTVVAGIACIALG
jgi:drug/metabolite transporter (DMT)-like permease